MQVIMPLDGILLLTLVIIFLEMPPLSTIASNSTCGGSVTFPWEARPKGGNYDGVKRLGHWRKPHVGTELPAVLLANGQVWLDSLWQLT